MATLPFHLNKFDIWGGIGQKYRGGHIVTQPNYEPRWPWVTYWAALYNIAELLNNAKAVAFLDHISLRDNIKIYD